MPDHGVRVFIVDDHEPVRAGLAALLRRKGFDVVGAVASAEEAIASLEAACPQVVVLDYRLPGMSGAEACTQIRRRSPGVGVLMLSAYSDTEVARRCVAAGAQGFLGKRARLECIAGAVRAVAGGKALFGSEIARAVNEWAQADESRNGRTGPLTPYEASILSLVAEGLANREIGSRLGISENTVKVYFRTIMRKLGVSKRAEAVAEAIRRGMIPHGE